MTTPVPTLSPLGLAALDYAARGVPVFPLVPRGKTPLTPHGFKDATKDLAQIEAWWTQHPNANIGMPTGSVSGLDVIDVDPRNGGDASLAALTGLPETPCTLTGGGGIHLFLAHDPTVKHHAQGLGDGIDVQSTGGYVVLPPSIHPSGEAYRFEALSPEFPQGAAPWPPHLLSRVARPASTTPLTITQDEPIAEGRRNQTLTSLAGTMRHKGMSPRSIFAALAVENQDRCRPPLLDNEVRNIAEGISRYEPAAPISGTDITDRTAIVSNVSSVGAPREWGDRLPLPDGLSAPRLPVGLIPAPLRDWCLDAASRVCIPPEFVVVPAIVAAGAAIGRSCGIRAGEFDDHVMIPNVWGATVGRPGTMKSYANSTGVRPLSRLEAKAREKAKEEAVAVEARSVRLKAELDAIKRKMARTAEDGHEDIVGLEKDYQAKKQELDREPSGPRRYMTQDATVEMLGELLKKNPRGLLVVRDELAGWFRGLEKAGREGDREFFLEAWNGDVSFTVDRIGRGTVHIPGLTLSILGGIQPGKLKAYIDEAVSDGWGADGLLQRIQLLVWPDDVGAWERPKAPENAQAREAVFQLFERLDTIACQLETQAPGDQTHALRFTPDAQTLHNTWRDQLEQRLRSKELAESPAFEAHLSKYRSLMPSLALIFHLIDVAARGESFVGFVSLASARLAAEWCGFLEEHACKLYAAELSPGLEAAHLLAKKIRAGAVADGVTVRDIYRNQWAGLGTPSGVYAALAILEKSGWLHVQIVETGGRPTEIVLMHPELLARHES